MDNKYIKITIGTFASDQISCFIRMMTKLTNMAAKANGMKGEACRCRSEVICDPERKIKKIFGVFRNSYKNQHMQNKITERKSERGGIQKSVNLEKNKGKHRSNRNYR